METLLIYDNTGFIIQQSIGGREPQGGVQYILVTIPDGKRIKYTDGIGVDIGVTPNVAILEDIPLTDAEINTERITAMEQAVNILMGM